MSKTKSMRYLMSEAVVPQGTSFLHDTDSLTGSDGVEPVDPAGSSTGEGIDQ